MPVEVFGAGYAFMEREELLTFEGIVRLSRELVRLGVNLRYIEYMDVGESYGWMLDQVVSGDEILALLAQEFPLVPHRPAYLGDVAAHWRHGEGEGEIDLIRSVTQPFCQNCQGLRLSADGKIFTYLFSPQGHDLRGLLRGDLPAGAVTASVRAIWQLRQDRYSEERGQLNRPKAEMSYLGG